MPELPEVQTVVSQLGEKIVGKKISAVWSEWKKAIRPSFTVFKKRVIGATIIKTRRFGKHIVMDLDTQDSIVIHLKMTGHLLVKTDANRESVAFQDSYNQFIHHVITFSDATTLEFSDMRKFGWMDVMKTSDVELLPSIASLGVDALSDALTAKAFNAIIEKKKKMKIGVLLLEQHLIAGIGNIYRSESLHQAGILPDRFAESLSIAEQKALLLHIKKVLRKALKYRGMSDGDFRDTNGEEGEFQKVAGVYGRHGNPCPKCGTILQRMTLGQRNAFFCPRCQK